jgi:hypothetical protein
VSTWSTPGMAWTPSIAHLERKAVPAWRLVWPLVRLFQRRASPAKAATAPIRLASAADLPEPSGTYYNEKARSAPLPEAATDSESVSRAWALGERWRQRRRPQRPAAIGRRRQRPDGARRRLGWLPDPWGCVPLRLLRSLLRAKRGEIADDELVRLAGMHVADSGKRPDVTYLGFARKA